MKKYYSTQRPLMIGCCPSKGLLEVANYDNRQMVPEIGREAWGYAIYDRELTDEEIRDYELVEA